MSFKQGIYFGTDFYWNIPHNLEMFAILKTATTPYTNHYNQIIEIMQSLSYSGIK